MGECVSCLLTLVESASALTRWVPLGKLTKPRANRVESAFYVDVVAGRFQVTAPRRVNMVIPADTEAGG